MTEEVHKKEKKGSSLPETDYKEPLIGHLRELRSRLFVVMVILFASMMLFYPFSGQALQYIWSRVIPAEIEMSVYSPLEMIMTRLKLSLAFATAITLPSFIYEIFRFASRGLHKNEKTFFIKIVPTSFILYIIGGSIALFVAVPIFFKYVMFYSQDAAIAQISLEETITSIVTFIMGFGIVFQIPLIMMFAIKMGLFKVETLKKQRVLLYSAFFGLSIFISPDPTFIAQLLSAFLLIVLFEISLKLVKYF